MFILLLMNSIQSMAQSNRKSPCGNLLGTFSILKIRSGQNLQTSLPNGAEIIFNPSEKKFNAYIGCNQMLGVYECTNNMLAFNLQASTRMACIGNIEDQFKMNLSQINKYKWVKKQLYCYKNKKLLMVLLPSGKPKSTQSLQGNYKLDSLWSGKSLFHADFSKTRCSIQSNKITCNVGCNNISGEIQSAYQKIEPLKLMMTEMYCAAVDALEKQFVNCLESSTRYEIEGAYLKFYNEQQLLIVFKRNEE